MNSFVPTRDKDGNTTHITTKVEKPVKKVTIFRWRAERKVRFWNLLDGEQQNLILTVMGIRTIKDKDGSHNTHLPRKVEKPVKYYDLGGWNGWVLKPRTDGEQPKENDGYEFVRTDKDEMVILATSQTSPRK